MTNTARARTARFLDGPMQGDVRKFLTSPPDEFVWSKWDGTGQEQRLDYRLKPNRFEDDELDWCYALAGSRIGDQVVAVVPIVPEALTPDIEDHLKDIARENLTATCATAGAVAVEVRERWRGKLSEALGDNPWMAQVRNYTSYSGIPAEHDPYVYLVFSAVAAVKP